MICLLLVCGGPCGQSTFAMSQCHWDLRGLGGKCVCLRGAVPLGSAKHAGINAACRW